MNNDASRFPSRGSRARLDFQGLFRATNRMFAKHRQIKFSRAKFRTNDRCTQELRMVFTPFSPAMTASAESSLSDGGPNNSYVSGQIRSASNGRVLPFIEEFVLPASPNQAARSRGFHLA